MGLQTESQSTLCQVSLLIQCYAVTVLKFLIIFEPGAQYFQFSPNPTNQVAGPDCTNAGYQWGMDPWVIIQCLGSLKGMQDLEMRTGEKVEDSLAGEETGKGSVGAYKAFSEE